MRSSLPLHPPFSSRRRGRASPGPAKAVGAQAAQHAWSRRSTSSLPSPCPARARGQHAPAHTRTPAPRLRLAAAGPFPNRSAQLRRPRAETAQGRRAAAAGIRSGGRPHTLLPFAASKQLAGALRAAPPSPRRGSAPPRARQSRPPAPPPPTWSVSLSTAILLLLRAHTHTGPESADVTPGAGEAEGIASGREKNLAPEFDSPPPAPPPAERLTLASGACSGARPPLYRKYRLLPARPPLTSPCAVRLGRRCLLPPAAAPSSPRPHRARRSGARRPPASRTCSPGRGELDPGPRAAPAALRTQGVHS